MAEALIMSERNETPEPASDPCLFDRKIHFHVARKPFNGFSNGNSNGFKLVTLNPNSGTHQSSGSGKKSEIAEYLDSGMDPELQWEITVRRIGAGLRNLGNTCFLNSVLQCLTYTEPLAAYLQSGKHQNSCRTTGFCALCAIQKHVSRALQATGRILEPKDLVSNLRCISRSFRNARQEDAHEYMVNLLESMHKCCLPSGVPSESPSAYEKSLVHKIFGGRLRSQVKCMQCSFCSNKFDPFLDLSLEILKADSLQKALCHFTAKEQLDGGARQYQCQQCKQKVKALKQLTIHKAPLVLAVHLKRFGHIHGQKIDKKIAFSPTLDLKPFVSGTYEGDLNYTLYGVLVHAGWSTHSGHYYCFVRTSSGMWYSLDDNQVVQVNERKVLEQKAYMLFYVRDRSSFRRKKPVNILPKESIAKNANGASAFSKMTCDSNEKSHNVSTENKAVDAALSAALSARDGQVATVLMDSPLKKIPLPSGSFSHSDSLPGVPSKNQRKDPQNLNMNTFESSASKIDCNDGALSAVQGQNPSVVVPPDCSVPKDSNHDKEASGFVAIASTCCDDKTRSSTNLRVDQVLDKNILSISTGDSCKMDDPNYGKSDGKAMSGVTIMEAWNQANGVKSPYENCAADNLVGVDLTSGNTAIEGTLKLKIVAKNKRHQFKAKRKRLKCQATIMLLGSSIILGASFSGVKKKHKPRKQPSTATVSNGLKHSSCGNDLRSNPEQSLSDKTSIQTDHLTLSRKKVKVSSSHENQEMCSKGCISKDVYSDFKERIVLGGATSAADNQQGPNDSEELARESREKDVMRMLTQGLEETTVARWDDASVSKTSDIRGTKRAQIGYIGDEWDEDYDKGKRKKLRQSKMDFDGPNLFQQIASRNSKQKIAKMDRHLSKTPPFRIP